jgi:uncharacterized membrane protein (UPF0127 family)
MQRYGTKEIGLAGRSYNALMADTSTKRAVGLMFRERLPKGTCMLFRFGYSGYHALWMHNMKFPIDVLWLDGKGAVVDMKEGLEPCKSMFNCPQYAPRKEASYVVELNAGEIRRLGLKAGSAVRI